MARLHINCTDPEGHEVVFVSSEKDGKELLEKYPSYQKWLSTSGFTQVVAKGTRSKKVWKFDGKNCPKCNKSEVWDNRGKIASNEFGPKSPLFACKDKACGWAVWEDQFEIEDIVNTAKEIMEVPENEEEFPWEGDGEEGEQTSS